MAEKRQSAGAKRKRRGFTMVELLVVIAILGLIGAFAVPALINQLGGAKVDAAKIQIDRLGGILDLYALDVGQYPSEDSGLNALLEKPVEAERWNGPYLKKADALVDPWGKPYLYRFPGENGEYDLYSLGADGQEGGEDKDADITSWQ